MFDTMFYVFMRVYLIWRHCKFKPVNCTVPHPAPLILLTLQPAQLHMQ